MEDRELTWRKSSRSGTNGNCVEVADLPNRVMVRDSKLGEVSPVLSMTRDEWRAFIRGLSSPEREI